MEVTDEDGRTEDYLMRGDNIDPIKKGPDTIQ
jgi:hypothetical protein